MTFGKRLGKSSRLVGIKNKFGSKFSKLPPKKLIATHSSS